MKDSALAFWPVISIKGKHFTFAGHFYSKELTVHSVYYQFGILWESIYDLGIYNAILQCTGQSLLKDQAISPLTPFVNDISKRMILSVSR